MWIGIDVGGRRKGFHAAAIEADRVIGLEAFRGSGAVHQTARWAQSRRPTQIAIDSPADWAPEREPSRPCERDFARARICGIRFTPSESAAAARTDAYYEWIAHGLELWRELRARALPAIECFPTASWTQWYGPRGLRSRTRWTRDALGDLRRRGLAGCDEVGNQDKRDAVAAALTARQSEQEPMRCFGPLIVPYPGTSPMGSGGHAKESLPSNLG